MRRAELGRQPLQTLGPPRPEYQVRPFGREPPRARLADSRTCAGDQDELSRDVTHVGDQNDSLPRSTTVLPSIATVASLDRKSTRLNSSHSSISYAVFCLKKKEKMMHAKLDNYPSVFNFVVQNAFCY